MPPLITFAYAEFSKLLCHSNRISLLIKEPFEGASFDSVCVCRNFEVVVPLESNIPGMAHDVHEPGRVLVCTEVLVECLQRCYV